MARGTKPADAGQELETKNQALASLLGGDLVGDDSDNRGSESVGTKDLQIPRIDLMQDLSPQIKEEEEAYIEGAKPGLLFNTLTGQLYGESVIIVPIFYAYVYNLWIDRKKGGGFRGSYPTEAAAKAEIPRLAREEELTEGSYQVIETAINYGFAIDESGKIEEVSIAFARTKLAASRKLNSLIRMVGGARWRRAFQLQSIVKKNSKGTFYTFDLKPAGNVSAALYERAEKAYEMFSKSFAEGKLRTDFDHDDAGDEAVGNRGDAEI
jgi:hypothetical protein